MPKVKRRKRGYIIVSHRQGQYITHQLSAEGVRQLEGRFGRINGLSIDVPTLVGLTETGDAYTRGQGREDRRPQREWVRPTPPPQPPTRAAIPAPPAGPAATPVVVLCPGCRHRVVSTASFCARCGTQLAAGSPPAAAAALPVRPDRLADYLVAGLMIAAAVAALAFVLVAFR
jgi:hypothetical protein